MKILLFIYVFSVCLFAVTFISVVSKAKWLFSQKHPDYKPPKQHWTDLFVTGIQIFMLLICPIVNIVLAFYMALVFDDFCDDIVRRLERRIAK